MSYDKSEVDALVAGLNSRINTSNDTLSTVDSAVTAHNTSPDAHNTIFDTKALKTTVSNLSDTVDGLILRVQNLEDIDVGTGLKGTLNYSLTGTAGETEVSITFDIEPINENHPVTYEVYGDGSLISGLTFNAAVGTITGTPTSGGTKTFIVLAKSGSYGAFITISQNFEGEVLEAEQNFNTIMSLLEAGDTDGLTDWLGVPISIPLNDHDGVTRNYRTMLTSIDTDDTPGYERNARFEFLDVVGERVYDAEYDNTYEPSEIRAYLTSEDADGFISRLPSWLKTMIVPTNIKCLEAYNSATTKTLTDKVFLPSAYELCGTIKNDVWYQEGIKSTYYPTSHGSEDKRIRYTTDGVVVAFWWTRTPHAYGASAVADVDYSGSVIGGNASTFSQGIAPAFVIAAVIPPVISVTPVGKVTTKANEAITDIQIQYQITNPVDGVEATFTASGLPPGLTMSSSGVISGTPTTAGTFSSTITIEYPGAVTRITTIEFTINIDVSKQEAEQSFNIIKTLLRAGDTDPLTLGVPISVKMADDTADTSRRLYYNDLEYMRYSADDTDTLYAWACADSRIYTDEIAIVAGATIKDVSGNAIGTLATTPSYMKDYRIMLTSVDTDDPTAGTYAHNARFEFLDVVDTRTYDSGNDVEYSPSDIRAYLTSEEADGFMTRLPSWLRELIVPTNIESVISRDSSTTETLSDKVFLPSAWEICGAIESDYWYQEGTKSTYYPISRDNEGKRVRFDLEGDVQAWWTRTPHRASGRGIICVRDDGLVNFSYNGSDSASNSLGAAPAFVIA